MRRQVVGRLVDPVVDAAGDQRLVRVALQEVDHHFHADPRDEHRAVAVAGPGLGHAHPARAVVVVLALAVPVELDLDPAMLVDVQLLAGGAGDQCGLRPAHQSLGRAQRRPPRHRVRVQGEFVAVLGGTVVAQVVAPVVPDRQHHVLDVELVEGMVFEREGMARGQRPHLAVAAEAHVAGFLGLHQHARTVLADFRIDEGARVAVALEVAVRADRQHRRGVLAQQPLALEVPVAQRHLAGAHLLVEGQGADRVVVLGGALVVEGQGGRLERRVAAVVVGEHQQMPAFLRIVVAEVVVDALALDQPGNEVEGGLVVLRAVVQRRMVLVEVEAEVAVVELLEDRLDDLAHRLALEDPAILVLGHEPEPGDDVAFVGVQVLALGRGRAPGPLEARDHAVPVALAAHVAGVPGLDAEDGGLADDPPRVDVVAAGEQAQAELEQLRHGLVPGHLRDQQVVLPVLVQGEEVHPVAGGKAGRHARGRYRCRWSYPRRCRRGATFARSAIRAGTRIARRA